MHAKLRSVLSCLGGTDAIVMQSIVGEELAQCPCEAARAGFKPATFCNEGTEHTTAEPPHKLSTAEMSSLAITFKHQVVHDFILESVCGGLWHVACSGENL